MYRFGRVLIVATVLIGLLAPQVEGAAGESGVELTESETTRWSTDAIPFGITKGDKGEGVAALQGYLATYGYLTHGDFEDRTFDGRTAEALQSFQRMFDLAPTGQVDNATLSLLRTPRYDHEPDVAANGAPTLGSYVTAGTPWANPDLTYAYSQYTPDLSRSAQRNAIELAFAAWAAITPLTFTEVSISASPDIVLLFGAGSHGDPFPFDGKGGTLAHAYYPTSSGTGRAGDAHFDDSETWTVNIPVPSGGIDLATVAIHEFGHSLGLGHSNNSNAIMAPYYTGANRNLHSDDIAGIQSLYGTQSGGGGSETIDAEVVSATASPATITQNSGDITISANIRNNGDNTAVISIAASGPSNWTDSTSISLSSGASGSVSFSWPAATTGSHSFTVTAALSGDESASNNTKTTNNVTVSSPPATSSLYVSGISTSVTPSESSHILRATVSVGPANLPTSGALIWGYWYNPANQSKLGWGYLNSQGELTFEYTTTMTGAHRFSVAGVKKSGQTYDSSLNVGNPAYIDVGGSQEPVVDASVDSVSASPTSIALNSGNVTIRATIGNNGAATATIPVSISGPNNFSATQNVSVGAGSTRQVTFTWPASVAGSHRFSVSTNLSGDTNSGNNQRTSPTVSVTEVTTTDVAIASLTVSPDTVEKDGPNITFTAQVQNLGSSAANVLVRLASNSASVNTTQVVTVSAGSTAAVEFQWSPSVAGNHSFTATAELSDDANASNNSKSTSVEVTGNSSPDTGEIYVSRILIVKSSTSYYYFTWVRTTDGQLVTGAVITGTVTSANGESQTITSTAVSSGRAWVEVGRVGTGRQTYSVENIVLDGYIYDPSLNVVTSRSAS